MKILFFIESLRSGGKERRLVELIKGLSKYPDIQMELVLTRKDIHYTRIFDTSIKIHYTVRKGLKKDPRLFWKFYKIARKVKPDFIHVWGNMVAVYAILAKVILGIPMINNQITAAPLKPEGGMLSYRITFPFSDKIIANSYAGLKSYNASKIKSSVIHNGFDFNRLNNLQNKDNIRKKFNIKTKYIVGMVASFSNSKDYTTYIKAANMVLKQQNNVTFLCLGSGNDLKYRKLVDSSNKDKVLFLGPHKDVESIMNICDIGVLATYTEGISNSLMEFMAMGKPVIATDGGGTKELVVDNQCGYLIPQKLTNILSEKIIFLLKNPTKIKNLGFNAKKRIETNFNIEIMIKKFIDTYKSFIY